MASPDAPIGELLRELAEKTGVLVTQELQLARAETAAQVRRAARDTAVLAAGAGLALAGLLAVVAAIVLALASAIPAWLSAAIVGVAILGGAYALILRGVRALTRVAPLSRTRQTLHEDKVLLEEQVR